MRTKSLSQALTPRTPVVPHWAEGAPARVHADMMREIEAFDFDADEAVMVASLTRDAWDDLSIFDDYEQHGKAV